MKKSAGLIFGTAVFCLLISGMAGLVYEIVWARYLALFLGHTSYAVVAVLVAFMGGLAIGNAWLGKRADRVRRPLALYAWLEVGIGLYALAFPYYYEICHQTYVALARSLGAGSFALLALKFVFSLLTILVPTIMMGGTLPVLTKLVTRSLGELQARVSALYFINSAGAVLGILVADFWWIPAIGLQMTVYCGAAMNLLVGAVALFVSGWLKEEQAPLAATIEAPAAPAKEEEQFTPYELRLAIIGIGVSGFVAMLYEVVWTRLLGLALGSSTHAFSLMLMTFITGIAAGAWVIYRWKTLRRTMTAFAWSEIALAGTLLASMFFYELLPFWFVKLAGFIVRKPETYTVYQVLQALICFSVMLIPALCLGMTLPLVSRIATAELARTGRSVGAVFSVNTVGTVLGAAVTGLWLMPWLGMPRTLAFGIAMNLLVGVIILARNQAALRRLLFGTSPFLAAGFIWLAGVKFDSTWQRAFTLGLWRTQIPPTTLTEYRAWISQNKITYYHDGAGSTVSVHTWQQEGKDHLSLKVNGKADASTMGDVVTQLLSGHIPLLLKPESQQALVIGLGSGMTCGAVIQHSSIQHLDVVEISPEVVEGARRFAAHNDNVLENPRVRLVVEDAKSFLQLTTHKYDAIISEPSNPWMAGVSGVFSREYYESCRGRLNEGGLMVQWVQLYETSDEAWDMILGTFTSAFPNLNVFQGSAGDLILVGSLKPLKVDLVALQKRFNEPKVNADLARLELGRVPVFLSSHIISQQNGLFVPPPDVQRHSDYYPTLEYVAQKAFFVRQEAERWMLFNENASTRATTLLGQYLATHPLVENDFKAFSRFFLTHHMPPAAIYRSLLFRWQQEQPAALLPIELAAKLSQGKLNAELENFRLASWREQIFKEAEKDPELLRLYQKFLMQTHRAHRSVFYTPPSEELQAVLERLVEVDKPAQRIYKLHLAELAWDRGDDTACLKLGQSAFDPDASVAGPINFDRDPRAPRWVIALMVDSLLRAGQVSTAWELCQDAKKNGYLGKADRFTEPLLEMTYRKVEAFVNKAQVKPRA